MKNFADPISSVLVELDPIPALHAEYSKLKCGTGQLSQYYRLRKYAGKLNEFWHNYICWYALENPEILDNVPAENNTDFGLLYEVSNENGRLHLLFNIIFPDGVFWEKNRIINALSSLENLNSKLETWEYGQDYIAAVRVLCHKYTKILGALDTWENMGE